MTRLHTRRGTLLLLAGVAMPAAARGQDTPLVPSTAVPAMTPPVQPSVLPSVPPGPTPPRAPPTPVAALDKTKAYYLLFDQIIDVNTMRALRRQLATLVEAGVSDITLVIDSPGGLIEPMLITYSFILALPAKINTHAQGFVQSAATALFLAGQERSADRNARFLFHPTLSSVAGVMGEQQMRERLTAFDVIAEVMAQIYRDRTNLPGPEIERFGREEVIYTANQAQASGVIQTVADLRIPGDGKAKILFLD